MVVTVPSYFEYLIEGFRRGDTGRFVHLGHWDEPEVTTGTLTPEDFARAQLRLNDILLELAQLSDGFSILDVGCGFGGTLEVINKHYTHMRLAGVNIDERQLDICQQLRAANDNSISWQLADACRLPFSDSSFDRLLCIEAMFHFASRRIFFHEAARVLKPGGIMVASDMILATVRDKGKLSRTDIESSIRREYGPWPDFTNQDADHRLLAVDASLRCSHLSDATRNTWPSHIFTAPHDTEAGDENGARQAALLLKWLHESNQLKYLYMRFEKP